MSFHVHWGSNQIASFCILTVHGILKQFLFVANLLMDSCSTVGRDSSPSTETFELCSWSKCCFKFDIVSLLYTIILLHSRQAAFPRLCLKCFQTGEWSGLLKDTVLALELLVSDTDSDLSTKLSTEVSTQSEVTERSAIFFVNEFLISMSI